MGELTADSKDKGFVRELVPGVWRLTGEVSDNLLDRLSFTFRVFAGASMARIEDLDSSIKPMEVQEILADDARRHIGSMALDRGLPIPEDFVPKQKAQLVS